MKADSPKTSGKKEAEMEEEDEDFDDYFINPIKKKGDQPKEKSKASEKKAMAKDAKKEEKLNISEEMSFVKTDIPLKGSKRETDKSIKAENKKNLDESMMENVKINQNNEGSICDQSLAYDKKASNSDSDSNFKSKGKEYDLNGTMMMPKKGNFNVSKNENKNQRLLEQSLINTDMEESMIKENMDNSTKEKSYISNESSDKSKNLKNPKTNKNINQAFRSANDSMIAYYYPSSQNKKISGNAKNYSGSILDTSINSHYKTSNNKKKKETNYVYFSQNDESFLAPVTEKPQFNKKTYDQIKFNHQPKTSGRSVKNDLNDTMVDGFYQEENYNYNQPSGKYVSQNNNYNTKNFNSCDNSMIDYSHQQKQKRFVSYDSYNSLADNSILMANNKMQKAKKYEHKKKIQEQDEDDLSDDIDNQDIYSYTKRSRGNNQNFNYKNDSGSFRDNLNDTMCGGFNNGNCYQNEQTYRKSQRFQYSFAENNESSNFIGFNKIQQNKKIAKKNVDVSLDESYLNSSLMINSSSNLKLQKEKGKKAKEKNQKEELNTTKKTRTIQDSFKKNFTEDKKNKNKIENNSNSKNKRNQKENCKDLRSKSDEEDAEFQDYFRTFKNNTKNETVENINNDTYNPNDIIKKGENEKKPIISSLEKELIENGKQRLATFENEEEVHDISNGVLNLNLKSEANE